MIKKSIIAFFLFSSFSVQASKLIYPNSITVFSNENYQINKNIRLPFSTKYEVINMDKLSQLDEEMSKNLPANHVDAKKAFTKMMNSKKWPEIADELKLAAFDIAKAAQYSLKKIPAIIFNDRDVIYGVTDIREALILYTKSKRRNK